MTQLNEARNGPFSARSLADWSNIPSPDLSDAIELKRGELVACVYRARSGQWDWQLLDAQQEMVGGGAGYDYAREAARDALAEIMELSERDDAEARHAALAREISERMLDALEGRKPRIEPGRDSNALRRTITEIDAIVQGETASLSAAAKLARRAVIAARETATGDLRNLLDDLVGVLATMNSQAGDLGNTVNVEAEAVGCNYSATGAHERAA